MKKFYAWVAVATMLTASPALADTAGVIVTRVSGEATIVGSAGVRPAAEGSACSTEDSITTALGGTVDIAVSGMAGCRLLPQTSCRIISADSKNMKLAVDSGNVILHLQKLPADSTFELQTPVAIASVRGTQFWGRVLPAGAGDAPVTFAVREGAIDVFVKSVGQSIRVEAGHAVDIAQAATQPPSVRPALDGELAAMAQAPQIATSM